MTKLDQLIVILLFSHIIISCNEVEQEGAHQSSSDNMGSVKNGGDNLDIPPPTALKGPLNVPEKLLMGPGPSNCYPKVLQATALPTLGHMHTEFFQVQK
jgi:hypothetical protein